MKKFFNYRPLVSICLFAIAGIVFVSGIYIADVFHIVLSVLSALALVCTIIVKALMSKEHKLFKLLSIVISFVLFSLLTFVNLHIATTCNDFHGANYIQGRIAKETYVNQQGKYVVTLDHAYIYDKVEQKAHKLKGKVMLYLTSSDGRSEDFELGTTVAGELNLFKPNFSNGKNNFYYANKRIYLLANGGESNLKEIGTSDRSLIQKYKLRVKDILEEYLSDDYSSLAYTMLFGDKAGMDEDISSSFSASGIAHLLAVSGLHVGFIVTMIGFILGPFKASKKTKFVVVSIVAFLYAMLCGFSVSVSRAFIMTAVLLYFNSKYKENDSLSALAFAGILLLLICPIRVYDAGFRLSFCAVLGIILLTKPMQRMFSKIFKPKLSSTLAVSLSAQIGTLPAMVFHFEKLSIFALVANLLAIPIASLAFMIMFFFVLLGSIFAPLGIGVYLFEPLMFVVTKISNVFASVTFAGANTTLAIVFTFIMIATVFLGSDYSFFDQKYKKISYAVGCGLSVLTLVLMFVI